MPDPTPSFADVLRAAAESIAATVPLPADWPARGAIPARNYRQAIRQAGWPTETRTIDLPQREHRGVRAGQRTGSAPQPVTVVPVAWLREMARRVGTPWPTACRGVVEG